MTRRPYPARGLAGRGRVADALIGGLAVDLDEDRGMHVKHRPALEA
jgi:hypothetical protein